MRSSRSNARATRWAFAALLSAATTGALTVGTAELAWAQGQPSEQDIAQARQLGQQAQAAFDAGNFAESEKLWAAAQKLYPVAPTLSLGLARTQTKLGKFVAAQENYNRIIREWSSNPSPPPAFKDALEAAKAEVGAVSSKIASVVITVEGPTAPQVTVDGQPVPNAALGFKRPIDPGKHVVKAEAQGYQPAETTFQVAEGGAAEAKLKLEAAPEAPAPVATPRATPATTEPPPGADTKKSSNKTLAIVAFGVGGVGLVVGTVTGLMAVGKHSDLESSCPNGVCPPDKQSDVDGYQTLGTVSTIGFVAAGVGLAAGAVLWFTAPKESASAGSGRYATIRPGVAPYVGPGAAGITGRF